MEERRMLTLAEREEIALAHTRGEGVRAIARLTGRDPSVISRELRRNTSKRGYRATTAHTRARTRRKRPQQRRMETDPLLRPRVLHDLGRGRTPRRIAGRLKLEAREESVEPMEGSIPAGGERISHEALYTWIYALPKGELARLGVMLPSKRGARRPRRKNGLSGGRIVGMRSIRERPEQAEGRRVPGHWEGDLVVGKEGKSAVIIVCWFILKATFFTYIKIKNESIVVNNVFTRHIIPAGEIRRVSWVVV